MTEKKLKSSLLKSWDFFTRSGIMSPADGSWGVAERIILADGNTAMQKTLDAFPAWTPKKDHYIIEQRRADCNMESAYLFLLMHRVFGSSGRTFRRTAVNILDFLYFKSGLLHRNGEGNFPGAWEWSHIKFTNTIYFDDNSWMVILPLKIARKNPALDRKYGMSKFALRLSDSLAEEAPQYLNGEKISDRKFPFLGNIRLPHWGSLVCAALAEAYRFSADRKYLDFVAAYEKFLMENADSFTTSEFGYAVIGASAAYFASGSRQSLECAVHFADRITAAIDPENGSIPSEHYEAPSGEALVDTVYTMNWALLALQNMSRIDPAYRTSYEKVRALLVHIQDGSKAKHLHGCWRGMYDLAAGCWGGGDRYEGGASSIYSGWTNAPIAWALAFDLLGSDLMSD